jgi:hypothetical protein
MIAADGTTSAVVPDDWRPGLQLLAELFSSQRGQTFNPGLRSAEPCQGAMLAETSPELWVDASARQKMIASAHAIVAGTIRSVTPGFFQSASPGSLIELDHLAKIKADAFYDRLGDTLFLRLPYAQFVTGGIEYCRESGPGKYAPKVGDRLLVFAYFTPWDADGRFVYTTSSEVIAQPAGGAIRIPPFLSVFDEPSATIETVTTSIRSELARTPRRSPGSLP